MKQVIKMKYPYILLFITFVFIFEMLTFAFVKASGIPSYFLLDLLISLFFSSLILLIKNNKATIIYLSILMFIITLLFLTNAIIYNIFGDIFTISYFNYLSEAGEVFEWYYLKPNIMATGIILFLTYIGLNILLAFFYSKKVKYSKDNSYITTGFFTYLLTTFIIGILFSITIKNADKTTIVNGRLVNNGFYIKSLSKKAMKHYGMLGLYYKECSLYIIDRNKENSDYNSDYNSESNYQGLLKNKNVITIMGETLQDFAIDKELTPNLYKLKYEGINFKRNYSVNKTNMSEMIGITGSYYSFYDETYDVDFAIPNILDGKYKTTYVHDNNNTFYDRGKLMNYFGFDKAYFHDDLYPTDFTNDIYPTGITGWENNTWHWSGDYTLDSVTIDRALPYLVDESNLFYSFWTTLSMHGPYDGVGSYSNLPKFKALGYYDKVINSKSWVNPLKGVDKYENYLTYYECAAMDLDVAIGKLLDYLEDKNLLDDTFLVIFGDHEAYYHDIYLKMANTSDKTRVDELYETTLIMYNKTLNDKYYTTNGTHDYNKFTSPLVVCPTILDLIGISYNKSNYANYSAFDSRMLEVFYSTQQRAFMNDYFYTSDLETLEYIKDKSIDSNHFFDECVALSYRLEAIDKKYDDSIVRDD